MKKWLVFILLLIVAAGTFIPCCSIDNCCADQLASSSNHKNEGTCSPFFAYATCPCSVELAKPVQFTESVVEKIVHQQAIIKYNLPTYSSSFWQPPRSC